MKKLVVAVALILGGISLACCAEPRTLTTLADISALSNADAAASIPVSFEATVSYARLYENLLFVQEGSVPIFVRPPKGLSVVPGDRVLVKGVTRQSFRPIIVSDSISVLQHGAPPKPIRTTFEELIRGGDDSMRVTLHGKVRAADTVVTGGPPVRSTRLQMLSNAGHFEVYLDGFDPVALRDLLDAEVDVTGVAAGKFDSKMQQTGVVLYTSSLQDIGVVRHAGASPWSLPITTMDKVLRVYHMTDLTPRVRVRGVITYFQPGSAVVLQDGTRSLWITTHTTDPLQIGDLAEASGFPDAHDRLLTLNDATIQDSHIPQPVKPIEATWRELAFWSSNTASGHQNDLVSIEGQVVAGVRQASKDEYVLVSGKRLFTAVYHHPTAGGELPSMARIPIGSRVRVTGICMAAEPNTISPDEEVPFNILLRSFDDIAIVASPSLLSVKNLMLLASILLLAVIVFAVWGWVLKDKVHRQTSALAVMANFEQHRSRILEDINGVRPLNEIVAEITEMVSASLNDAPCWCDVADGDTLGVRPNDLQGLRLIHVNIGSRNGPTLGRMFAGLNPGTPPEEREIEALSGGARLAALAIETRRHYSDLRHRSEFDLLTGTHNRFSFERHLDARLDEARQNCGIVGVIYIDFDHFKSVNDVFGHRIGDLFLQEAVSRMKRQLRAVDILGRLGGDEFVALIPQVRSRADVEEIASRLEHCFDAPFVLEEMVLDGATSVGVSVYPEDATSRECLLSAADAAMYANKFNKPRVHGIAASHEIPEIESDGNLPPSKG